MSKRPLNSLRRTAEIGLEFERGTCDLKQKYRAADVGSIWCIHVLEVSRASKWPMEQAITCEMSL